MDFDEKSNIVKKHWENMSKNYGVDLKATTKTTTIKKLEINALVQAISYVIKDTDVVKNVLEVGCGNGYNCCSLSKQFSDINFTGVDYIPDMVKNAKAIAENEGYKNITYLVGDILDLGKVELLPAYDIVFTDRCIINLDSVEKQKAAIFQLYSKVADNGHLILIENIVHTYDNQNSCRELIGLEKRISDSYNLFLDETLVLNYASELSLKLADTHDFGSLHDLLLYVLLPKLNGGKVDYDNPLIDVVTEFCINASEISRNKFGEFGQNRLYLFKKAVN